MNQYITYLKKDLILLFTTFCIMVVGLYLYNGLNTNTQNLKQEVESLKSQLQTEYNSLKKMIKEYNKEKQFERQTEEKKLIDPYNKTLDIYFVYKDLQKQIRKIFTNAKIQSTFKPLKGKYNLTVYKVNIYLPYENKYFYKKFFDYLNSKYYYFYEKVNYSSKTKNLMLELYLIGKKGKKHVRNH